MRRSAADTREQLLSVAHDLFYSKGIHATGVDQVAATAEVAPTTLYRLFDSKELLVGAYVERADQLARGWFVAALDRAGDDPRARILSVFDAIQDEIRSPEYRGCGCLMALAEFPDDTSPAHVRAVDAKRWVHQRFTELVAELAKTTHVSDPSRLADELTLLLEGVHATAQALGTNGPAERARGLAELALDHATKPRKAARTRR